MSIAPTTNILEAVRELYIKCVDPSHLNSDPYEGLNEKEKQLQSMTEDWLLAAMPDYVELEEAINIDLGDNFRKLLTGAESTQNIVNS